MGQFPTWAELEEHGLVENGRVVLSQKGYMLSIHAPSSVTWTGPKAETMRRIAQS